jgi:hypothetical protein
LEWREGFTVTAHRVVEIAEVVLGIGVIRSQARLFLVSSQGLLGIAAVEIGVAKTSIRRCVIRVQPDG